MQRGVEAGQTVGSSAGRSAAGIPRLPGLQAMPELHANLLEGITPEAARQDHRKSQKCRTARAMNLHGAGRTTVHQDLLCVA